MRRIAREHGYPPSDRESTDWAALERVANGFP
jgi:hypothetical protein